MISLELLYLLVGAVLAVCAVMTLLDATHPARVATALFWGAYAALFLVGDAIPPAIAGGMVVAMALLAGARRVRSGASSTLTLQHRLDSVARLGPKLVAPALLIPVITIAANYGLKHASFNGSAVLSPVNTVLESLGLACVVSLLYTLRLTRDTPVQALRESRRLLDAMGWTIVLPQALAMLGLVFIEVGAGKATAALLINAFDLHSKLVAISVFAVGMAALTFVLGNAFAAFPVIAAGVGIPVLVNIHHANPAIMAAIGMFSAYCGSAMTPMNATYSILPTSLLDIPDKYAVIKAQIPTVLPLLLCNIALLYLLI